MIKRDELGHTYHWYENEIARMVKSLADTDYITLKYVEGDLDKGTFLEFRTQRAALREKVREYEAKAAALKEES